MSYVNKNYEKFDLDIIKNFIINSSPESKIYLGADSTRYSKIENGKKYGMQDTLFLLLFTMMENMELKFLVIFQLKETLMEKHQDLT